MIKSPILKARIKLMSLKKKLRYLLKKMKNLIHLLTKTWTKHLKSFRWKNKSNNLSKTTLR